MITFIILHLALTAAQKQPDVSEYVNDLIQAGVGTAAVVAVCKQVVSSAVTVGSTTKQDTLSSYSNMSNTVDLLAPGENITSSVPGAGSTS